MIAFECNGKIISWKMWSCFVSLALLWPLLATTEDQLGGAAATARSPPPPSHPATAPAALLRQPLAAPALRQSFSAPAVPSTAQRRRQSRSFPSASAGARRRSSSPLWTPLAAASAGTAVSATPRSASGTAAATWQPSWRPHGSSQPGLSTPAQRWGCHLLLLNIKFKHLSQMRACGEFDWWIVCPYIGVPSRPVSCPPNRPLEVTPPPPNGSPEQPNEHTAGTNAKVALSKNIFLCLKGQCHEISPNFVLLPENENPFCLFIWGPGGDFLYKKCRKSRDTVSLMWIFVLKNDRFASLSLPRHLTLSQTRI